MKSIAKCNNSSAPGPDKLLWSYLKYIINNEVCLGKIISIANTCFELGLWLVHFKSSTTIIILKPNKKSYDSPKFFQPIILLNILGKLIKKVIGKHLQFHLIVNNFVTNFIQLVSPQLVDWFSQTKLCWKAPNEGYPHICGRYKSNNKQLRYQDISSCKSFVC